MDPYLWRNISYVASFMGAALVLFGTVGTIYFGRLVEAIAPYNKIITYNINEIDNYRSLIM